jgi:Sec-independent protein secretion pathway component TatC
MKKFITAFYIFMLCSSIAVIFILGSFVAPVIFHTEQIHGIPLLSRYDAGLLMSQIFVKSNYILLITLSTIIFYDGIRLMKKKSNALVASLAGLSVVGLAAHIFFFTPQVLEYQAAGAAATALDTFNTIHKLSEADFKFTLAALICLVFVRLSASLKDDCCGGEEK